VDKIVIEGGRRLHGEVAVSGSKNAALPILISSLLTADRCAYQGVPHLADIRTTLRLLAGLGVAVDRDKWNHGTGDIQRGASKRFSSAL
jgi:UDP-N-acetylglucosamine 1-carboxyvinyltransferase